MKKPSNKPQLLRRSSELMNIDGTSYTADELQDVVDQMRDLKVEKIEFLVVWDGNYCFDHYYEIEQEALVRFTKESKKYDTYLKRQEVKKEKHKQRVRKQAIKLGLIPEE